MLREYYTTKPQAQFDEGGSLLALYKLTSEFLPGTTRHTTLEGSTKTDSQFSYILKYEISNIYCFLT
jgi:hypothetical protein